MAIIRVTATGWPLVLSTASGAPSLTQHIAYLSQWQGWFARGEPFAVVRHFSDAASLVHPEGAARATKVWLSDGAGDAIRRHVLAMVNIVPVEALPAMAGMSIERVFGVPGMIGDDVDAALRWLNDHLQRMGAFPVDPDAAAARLRALATP